MRIRNVLKFWTMMCACLAPVATFSLDDPLVAVGAHSRVGAQMQDTTLNEESSLPEEGLNEQVIEFQPMHPARSRWTRPSTSRTVTARFR